MEETVRPRSLLLVTALFVAPELHAQRLSGEGSCSRPDTTHTLPVGDRPDHFFAISRVRCTWTKPFEIAGTQAQGGTAVQFDELSGNTARFHGIYLDVMSSGDTVRYQYQGTATFKDDQPQSAEWNWRYAGGTGKLTKLAGKGNCKGRWIEGINQWRCTGEYRLPN
jgi:hypothetical protein